MKYVKRYNKFNLQTNCRICLTQSVTTKQPLSGPLKGDQEPSPLVYEALELITNEKVPRTKEYPDSVCGMCVELLKISYDLVMRYRASKKKLKEQLGELGENCDSETEVKDKRVAPQAPVEIVVGSEKFDIKDLLIVEEESDDAAHFDGFLRNLGKTISASFVKKGHEKPKPQIEAPSLIIEKVVQEPIALPLNEPYIVEMSVEDLEPIATEVNDENSSPLEASNEARFLDEPANTKVFDKLKLLDDKDKDVLESALNLKYKCPYCDKPMASLTRAQMHSRTCGKNTSNATCYVCGSVFDLRKHLLRHIKKVHLDEVKVATKLQKDSHGKYVCRVCGKSFTSNGSMFYHMSKHSGKRYGCEECDKRFYTKTQVRNHAQTHSREKTVVVCPVCGKGFHYRSGLFYHMKMHTNERNLQCSFCPRRFYTRNSVNRHELTHTGARPYACRTCDKRFRSLGEVRKHELLHTGERPFQCKYCDMGFTQAYNLKMHMMTHSGQFQCVHCSKTFADIDILKFHFKNKHQIDSILESMMEASDDVYTIEEQEEMTEVEEAAPEDGIPLEEQTFYITEQFNEDDVVKGDDESSDMLCVKTFEFRDEVLVETVEDLN